MISETADQTSRMPYADPMEMGSWGDGTLDELLAWDAAWILACGKLSTNPWTSGILSRKFAELVSVALNAACTNLNADGTRRHIRAALDAGATRDEVLLCSRPFL
jgi:alkylhydroperoxidase/carboxymuconolactone decarboxylase family protein YurZ